MTNMSIYRILLVNKTFYYYYYYYYIFDVNIIIKLIILLKSTYFRPTVKKGRLSVYDTLLLHKDTSMRKKMVECHNFSYLQTKVLENDAK